MVLLLYAKCINKPALVDNALSQIFQSIEKRGDFFNLRLFVKRHQVEPYVTSYRLTLQRWYWEKSNLTIKEKILDEFRDIKHEDSIAWLNEIKLYEKARKEKEEISSMVFWNRPAFDGEAYNKSLESYLVRVQKFKESYHSLTQSTQTDLAIFSTKLFANMYLDVGAKIQGMKPAGLDVEIVKDFQGAMKQVASPFLKSSAQYEVNLNKALREKESLTSGSRSIASVEEVENPVNSFFTGLTMDKE